MTNLLDEQVAPAAELAALYHERWEIESAFDELKTHLRGRQIVLRSKTPELALQEFYGLLLAHFAVRSLMHQAALHGKVDPDKLSLSCGPGDQAQAPAGGRAGFRNCASSPICFESPCRPSPQAAILQL